MSRRSVNLTEEEWAEIQRRRETAPNPAPKDPKPRGMNKTETLFSMELEARKQAGEILWWEFEGMRLRLADGAYYKPDFYVMMKDGSTVFYEIKGFWREAARVRLKVAADRHPYVFTALQKKRTKECGGWDSEVFCALWRRLKWQGEPQK